MDASKNRREFKFLLRPGLAAELRREVAAHLPVDDHSNGSYPVISEYYDTRDRASYWQKQFGVANRRRVRLRVYGREDGSIPPSAFIEVKHKLEGVTVKRRLPIGLADLAKFSQGRLPDLSGHGGAVDARIIAEIGDLVAAAHPVVQIRYQRHAYDSGPDGTIRITFDSDLMCRFRLLPLAPDDQDFDLPLTEPGAAVMEVKTAGPVPYWFRRLVGRHGLMPRGFSKYSVALEKYEFNPSFSLDTKVSA